MFLAATLKYHPGDMEIKTRTDSHAREERMDFNSVKPPHTHRPHGNKNKVQLHTTWLHITHHTERKKLPHHSGGKKLGMEGHTAHDSISQQTVMVTRLGIVLKTIKQSKKTTDTKLVSLKSA